MKNQTEFEYVQTENKSADSNNTDALSTKNQTQAQNTTEVQMLDDELSLVKNISSTVDQNIEKPEIIENVTNISGPADSDK